MSGPDDERVVDELVIVEPVTIRLSDEQIARIVALLSLPAGPRRGGDLPGARSRGEPRAGTGRGGPQ